MKLLWMTVLKWAKRANFVMVQRRTVCVLAIFLSPGLKLQAQTGYPNNMIDAEDELLAGEFSAPSTSLPVWMVSEPYLNLWIHDQPVTYRTSYGVPVGFGISFKQRNARSNTHIFSMGPSWESSWLSYVEYTNASGTISVGNTYVKLGGVRSYTADGTTKEFKSASTMAKLTDGGGNFTAFQINYPSGARDIYSYLYAVSSSENYAFLSQQIDPVGRTNQFVYDTISGVVRLRQMIDFDNRTNTVLYDSTFTSQIKEVDDPYGRKAAFSYNGSGQLAAVVNAGNLTNSFYYDAQGLVMSYVTFYGTNSFVCTTNATAPNNLGGNNAVNRSVRVTEPDGGKQLYLYRDQSTKLNSGSGTDLIPASYPTNEVPNLSPLSGTLDNTGMDARNTFYWGAKQYDGLNATFKSSGLFTDLTVADYKIGRLRHWLRGYNNASTVSPSLSMERASSPDGTTDGAKTWYDYTGKVNLGAGNWGTRGTNALPSFVAKVWPDGTTGFSYTERNQWENLARVISSYTSGGGVATRTNTYNYGSNGIDLTELRGPGNELLSSNLYNSFHQVSTHFNPVSDRTDFNYDSSHRLLSAVFPTGLAKTNTYYPSGSHIGWLQTTTDYDSSTGTALRTNSFTYANGLVASVTDERNLTVNWTWDDLLRPLTMVTPSSTNNYQYTGLNPSVLVNALGNTNSFSYDSLGRMLSQVDAASTNSVGYVCAYPCHFTNGLQQVTHFSYNYNANVLSISYPDTSLLTYRYDAQQRRTNVIDAANNSVSYFYNNQNLIASASNAFGLVLQRQYDALDRLTNQVDANGVTVSVTYDNLGRVLTKTYPDNGVEKFEYSPRGLITYTNQIGFVTHYGYDALRRKIAVTNANNEVLRFAYSPAGDVTSFTDGKNHTNQFQYDRFGRLTNKIAATTFSVLQFKYDAIGRMTNRWVPVRGNTTYRYDQVNNLTNIVYPMSSAVTFKYDAGGHLTNMIDEVGSTVFYYTSFGALLAEDGPWANDRIIYDYRTNHQRASFTLFQPNGSLVVQSYDYDAADRLQSIASPAGAFTYSYQGAGNLVQKILYPNGAYVTNSYDSVARLWSTRLRNSGNTDLSAVTYGYDLAGQRTNVSRLDGSSMAYGYDNIGQLTSAKGKESGGTSRLNEQFGYAYDAANNLQYRTNNALVQTFSVDNRNQLTGVSRTNTLTVAGTVVGSPTTLTVNGLTAALYNDGTFVKDGFSLVNGTNTFTVIGQDSYGRSDTNSVTVNLPASLNYTYDWNGNLSSDGTKSYEYDDENRLIRVIATTNWQSRFTYDGFGRRRIRSEWAWVSGGWTLMEQVRTVYDGNLPLQDRRDGDGQLITYSRGLDLSGGFDGAGGIGGLLARTQNPGGPDPLNSFYFADGSGNVTTLLDSNQQVVAKYLYDPFGNTLAASGPMADANLYRFSSKEVHENTGMYYYGLRFYEPRLQRWLNGDPLREGGGINQYSFAGNGAINTYDGWGLSMAPPSIQPVMPPSQPIQMPIDIPGMRPPIVTDPPPMGPIRPYAPDLGPLTTILRDLFAGILSPGLVGGTIFLGSTETLGDANAHPPRGEALPPGVSRGANGKLYRDSDGKELEDQWNPFNPKNFLDDPKFKLKVNPADLAALRGAERDTEYFLGTIAPDGTVNLYKGGENGILGHSDLVNQGLATPGQTMGFSVGLDSEGNVAVNNMSELNKGFGNGGMLPTQLYNSIKNALGGR